MGTHGLHTLYYVVPERFFPGLFPGGLRCPCCKKSGNVRSQGWASGSPRFVLNEEGGVYVHFK